MPDAGCILPSSHQPFGVLASIDSVGLIVKARRTLSNDHESLSGGR